MTIHHAEPPSAKEPATTVAAPPIGRPRLSHVPRLSIVHFMAWTAITAVHLAAMRVLVGSLNTAGTPPVEVLIMAVSSTIAGWIYFCSLLVLWHAIRRTLWRLEPGEWLILCAALSFLASLVSRLANIVLSPGETFQESWFVWYRLLLTFELAWIGGGFVVAAMAQRHRAWWCAFHALCAVPLLITILAVWTNVAILPETLVIFLWAANLLFLILVFVFANVGDRRRRAPRHWMHWSGVGLGGLMLLLLLGVSVVALVSMNV
jgi:hypothetical protein